MDNLAGYARSFALARVEQIQQKPLFRNPYLKLGQCLHLWSYVYMISGVLGGQYTKSLDEFGTAFLGVRGERGAVLRFFTDVSERFMNDLSNQTPTIFGYIIDDSMTRLNPSGDSGDFFTKFGSEKIQSDTAVEVAWQHAGSGAALGAIYPSEFRRMFEQTNEAVPTENWKQFRAAGLDIPEEPTRLGYEDVKLTENQMFMAYCRECCPELHAVLDQD